MYHNSFLRKIKSFLQLDIYFAYFVRDGEIIPWLSAIMSISESINCNYFRQALKGQERDMKPFTRGFNPPDIKFYVLSSKA